MRITYSILAMLLGLAFSHSALCLETTLASFQVRPENESILVTVNGEAKSPAAEIVALMEKAGTSKTIDSRGNPTYTQTPLWAFSSKNPVNSLIGYAFFSRIPLADKSWSLTSLVASDESVNPAITIQGTELFLDNETSKVLFEIMGKAGLTLSTGGAVSTYKAEWLSCDKRSFNPAKPFFVCVIKNYKW